MLATVTSTELNGTLIYLQHTVTFLTRKMMF